jgi:hypothetical protein
MNMITDQRRSRRTTFLYRSALSVPSAVSQFALCRESRPVVPRCTVKPKNFSSDLQPWFRLSASPLPFRNPRSESRSKMLHFPTQPLDFTNFTRSYRPVNPRKSSIPSNELLRQKHTQSTKKHIPAPALRLISSDLPSRTSKKLRPSAQRCFQKQPNAESYAGSYPTHEFNLEEVAASLCYRNVQIKVQLSALNVNAKTGPNLLISRGFQEFPALPNKNRCADNVTRSTQSPVRRAAGITPERRGNHYEVAAAFLRVEHSAAYQMQELFTIGHSTHEQSTLLRLLEMHGVTAVADVRSNPFSARLPQFNRAVLDTALDEWGIRYTFLGKELGARRDEQHCYVDGQARYDRIAETPAFAEGINRVINGLENYRIALLCAEKDPITCHRTILVCRHLRRAGLTTNHILADGKSESHAAAETRLREQFGLNQPSLFESPEQQLEEAYDRQALQIAYHAGTSEDEEQLPTAGGP